MPEFTTATTAPNWRYNVWINGVSAKGSAERVLARIQREVKPDSGLARLTVEEYANGLIQDASYFFPHGRAPELLASYEFPTSFDKALAYLDAMPSSGIRILSRD
jgi:hypothetical protein